MKLAFCLFVLMYAAAAAAAKSLQSCPTLCDPIDGSPPGSPVPGILQARTLEWVDISFSNAWKWSRSVMSDSSRPHGLQPTRLLHPWDFPGKSSGMGCHCLLHLKILGHGKLHFANCATITSKQPISQVWQHNDKLANSPLIFRLASCETNYK